MANVSRLRIQLLGATKVLRDGAAQAMPQSRKTRGLLCYLALSSRKESREKLCRLIWDGPNDPRAALRWSLSKLRVLLSDGESSPLLVDREGVVLDKRLVEIDMLDIGQALDDPHTELTTERLLHFETSLAAGYLSDLDDVGSVEFQLWLDSERETIRFLHGRVLDTLLTRYAHVPAQALVLARKRVALAPSDTQANLTLLRLCHASGGQTHAQSALEQMRAHYRAEGLNDIELVSAWKDYRQLHGAGAPCDRHISRGDAGWQLRPTVAVLAFKDLTGADEHGLASGLAVDLSARLAREPLVQLIARASAQRFEGTALSPREIGLHLGARYLVTGTTQWNDSRVRVTVSVLDTSRDEDVWSEQLNCQMDDVFELQDHALDGLMVGIMAALQKVLPEPRVVSVKMV